MYQSASVPSVPHLKCRKGKCNIPVEAFKIGSTVANRDLSAAHDGEIGLPFLAESVFPVQSEGLLPSFFLLAKNCPSHVCAATVIIGYIPVLYVAVFKGPVENFRSSAVKQ
jgi:hypothetical protein